MSAILDILIIAIIALTIFFAAKRGFVRTLLGSASVIIAIAVAFLFIDPVKAFLADTSIAENTRNTISDTLAGFVSSDGENYDPKLLEDNSGFVKMITLFGISEDEIQTKWDEWRNENSQRLKEELEEYVAEPVVNAVVTVAAFCILFFGSLIILKLATFLLDRFVQLPVLKQANTFLGVLLGVVIAVVEVYLFVKLMSILIPYGSQLGWGFFKDVDVDDTLLFGWFDNHNLFNIFFG